MAQSDVSDVDRYFSTPLFGKLFLGSFKLSNLDRANDSRKEMGLE